MKRYLFLLIFGVVSVGLAYLFAGAGWILILISLVAVVVCLVIAHKKVGMPPVKEIMMYDRTKSPEENKMRREQVQQSQQQQAQIQSPQQLPTKEQPQEKPQEEQAKDRTLQ